MNNKAIIALIIIFLISTFIFSQEMSIVQGTNKSLTGELLKPGIFSNKNNIILRVYDLNTNKYDKIIFPLNNNIKYEGVDSLKKIGWHATIQVDYYELNNSKVIDKIIFIKPYEIEYLKNLEFDGVEGDGDGTPCTRQDADW